MPGLAHIVTTLGLCLFLYNFTNKRFGIKHSIIVSVNSFVGPDLSGIFFDYESYAYLFFHGYGWLVMAIPVALMWCLFTYYKLQWQPFKVEKRDANKEPIITWPEVYCLVAAGGILHQFVDLLAHPAFITYEGVEHTPWGVVWFGGDNYFSMEWILGTGMFPCGNELGFTEFYIFLPIVLIPSIILMFFYMQKSEKAFYKSVITIFLIYVVPLSIIYFIPDYSGLDVSDPNVNYFGDESYISAVYRFTGGEAEFGIIVFLILFLYVPLLFIYFGYNGVPFGKKTGIRAEIEKIDTELQQIREERIKKLIE